MGMLGTWRRWGCAIAVAGSGLLAGPALASAATVSLWHMDETSGSVMHDAVGANDGTIHGGIALGQPGFAGLAYGFHNHPPAITVASDTSLNPGGSAFWMSARIKFSTVPKATDGDDYDLIRKGLSSTSGGFWKMEVLPSTGFTRPVQAHCSMKGSLTSQSVTAGPDLADGQWHQVQCLKETNALSVIVDGVKTTVGVTLGSFSNSAVVAVGGKELGGDFYDGVMDELSFGTGALPVAPANTAAPAISGTPATGQTLSVSTGSWSGTAPLGFAYQWQRCSAAGAGCADIPGATQATRVLTTADQGSTLRAVVTASNDAGSAAAPSAVSGVVAAPGLVVTPPGGGAPGGAPGGGGGGQVGGGSGPAACTPLTADATSRKLKLGGASAITLTMTTATGALQLRSPRGVVRSVTFTLDGKRIKSTRGGSLKTTLKAAKLKAGKHLVRALIHPRKGKSRTLLIRITVRAC
jgi:hypothetical protein